MHFPAKIGSLNFHPDWDKHKETGIPVYKLNAVGDFANHLLKSTFLSINES